MPPEQSDEDQLYVDASEYMSTPTKHCNLQPTAYNLQPTTYNLQPTTTYSLQPTTYSLQPTAYNPQPTTYNLQPTTFILICKTCDLCPRSPTLIRIPCHARDQKPDP
jgi:hypothetical protein